MRRAIVCCALVVLVPAVAWANLLANGGFEDAAAPGEPVRAWTLSPEAAQQRVTIDAGNAHRGRGCLAVRSTRTTKAPGIVSQRVQVEPNSTYVMSLWAKRDSFVYGTSFQVVLLKRGEPVGRQSKNFRGSDWFPLALGFGSGDADTAEIRIVAPNTGTWRITVGRTLWVDDAQLVKIDARDNLVLRPGPATDRGPRRLSIAPTKGGPYYAWLRARGTGPNAFVVRTADGRAWRFRSHTASDRPRWTRPVLPEFFLQAGQQQIEFTASGDVAVDQLVLTMDPFWRPEGATDIMGATEAIAAQREKGFKPARRGSVGLSVAGRGAPQPWTRTRWPLTQGVPFPRGALASAEQVRLTDAAGESMATQAEAFARWPDGSIKWLLVSTFAPKSSRCRLEYGAQVRPPAQASRLRVSEGKDGVEIDTGRLKVRLASDGSPLVGGLWVRRGGRYERIVEQGFLRANERFLSTGRAPTLTIEERGPVRATVKVAGQFVADGQTPLDYVVRIHAYDGCDFLAMEHTFLRRSGPLKLALDDVAVVVDMADRARLRTLSWDGGSAALDGQRAALVSRISSDPKRPNDYPFAVRVGEKQVAAGARYEGHVTGSGEEGTVGVCVRRFWENSPKSISAGPGRVEVGLVAPGEPVEFFRGMAKTHEIMLHFGSDAAVIECFAMKPLLAAAPEWYCASGAFDARPAPRRDDYPHYERCIDQTLLRWRDTIAATALRPGCGGMIHAGDFGGGRSGFMNLESALGEGLMVQFLRTGARAVFDQADLSLSHFSDVDIDHSDDYAGLIYLHGKHGREAKSVGDGVNGHSWFNGVATYGMLTGSRRIREQAAQVGRVYSQHEFPLQPYIHYWRKIAWKLMDLECAYDLTGRVPYLEAARRDVIVTRHQQDNSVHLWPYMIGVGMKALRHYYGITRDPEVRELYLQMMDGFLRLRSRPNDTVNGEHLKRPGMLFGNFPNDRSCAFYNELAHAYWLSGDERYVRLGAGDLSWQVRFAVNDPTLLWGSSDLVAAMRERRIPGPAVAQSLRYVFMPARVEPSPLFPSHGKPTIVFQVVEKTDQAFKVSLFKGCYRKYTTDYRGAATLYAPNGDAVSQQAVSTAGLGDFVLDAPRDGMTGVYTVRVCLDNLWRWTLNDASFDLAPGKHRLRVSPRYDRLWFDSFILTPDLAYFPGTDAETPADAIAIEAESAALAEGYLAQAHAGASGGRYVCSTVSRNKATMGYAFRVPGKGSATRLYRLHARIWKASADLLNVWVDDRPVVLVQQIHDMDGNVYPIWAVGTTLGDDAVVRYWSSGRTGRPWSYTSEHLHTVRLKGD